METKNINDLRKTLKQFNLKHPRGCKKVDLIRLLKK